MDADVIIVGAGLAGLRCAHQLELSGRRCLLLESSDAVGGRVKSRTVDDAIIDEGFQLANPAYPEIRAIALGNDLDWRRFAPVLRFVGSSPTELIDPRYAPLRALRSLRSCGLTRRDLVGLLRVARSAATPSRSILADDDMPAREGLRRCGVSEGSLDRLLTPFLSGVVLDDFVDVPWGYVRFLLKSFLKDRPATTPDGLGQLPRVLAARLASDIRLSTVVTDVQPTEVRTSQGVFRAPAVVVATDADSARRFVPTLPLVAWRSQTTWWWRAPRVEGGAELRLPRLDGPLTSVLDLASVAPERCPRHSLLAAAANGTHGEEMTEGVRGTVARLYDLDSRDLDLVEVTRVEHALPVITTVRPRASRWGDIFLAGDYLTTPSTQGALHSGYRAARAVLAATGTTSRR